MPITENHKKESFSQAYVQAIASMAGAKIDFSSQFDYGIDATFSEVIKIDTGKKNKKNEPKYTYRESGLKFLAQLKCSHNVKDSQAAHLEYRLDKKNYDDLILKPEPCELQKILIVVHVPKIVNGRFEQSPEKVSLANGCYFLNLSGNVSRAETKVLIKIPKINILTPDKIREFFALHREGKKLA